MTIPAREPTTHLPLADGRSLDLWVDEADRGGGLTPLVFHSGTPASGYGYEVFAAQARERGLRMVGWSRPGYGSSTRLPGRRVSHIAGDTAAVLDHIGAERAYVVGHSGGGPHALACAALLGDRVAAAATLASVGPYDADGLDFLAGMGEDNVEELGAAVEGAEALTPWLEAVAPRLLEADPDELAEGLKSLLSPPDVAVINDGLAAELIAVTGEGIRATRDGWLDDDLAFVKPWGFDVGSISVPLQLWQGRQDLMVPAAHAEWLAGQIPGVDVRFCDDDGHLSLEHVRIGDVHAWLLERY